MTTVTIPFSDRTIWQTRLRLLIAAVEEEQTKEHQAYIERYNSAPWYYKWFMNEPSADPLDRNHAYWHFSPVRLLENLLEIFNSTYWATVQMDARDYNWILSRIEKFNAKVK